ncbi:FadR/GntR family transcriptional regulator [Silicimonas algicola]|uniref:FadR/GntR family transcriptional regulator n=1 Tax=Silicimonas algicola TaxID=1826607 RepID=UPI001475E63D|nr:FadR/GntR family transcriptional regulator [Silicimonas algicola]
MSDKYVAQEIVRHGTGRPGGNFVAEAGAQTTRSETGSAVDGVVESIRALIGRDGLTVGDSLPTERELCDAFGASRNTVREAMRILKAYGIVEVRPKVGATIIDNRMASAFEMFSFNVLDLSPKTFSDIQGFRALLEVSSVETLFERMTPSDLAELRRINTKLTDMPHVDVASEYDFEFHTKLMSLLDNKAILDVYGLMKPVILRIMKMGKSRRTFETTTYREHEAILAAAEAGDRLGYQYLMKTHLNAGYALFQKTAAPEAGKRDITS